MATVAAESSFHPHSPFAFGRGGVAATSTATTTTTTTVDPIPLRPGTVRPPTLCGQEIHMPEGAPEIKSPELRPWTGPFLNAHSRSRGSTDSVNTHGSSSRSNSARSNRPVTPSTMQDELPTARGSVRAQVENMEAKVRERERGGAERPTLHRTKSRSSTRTTFPGPQYTAAASQVQPEAPPPLRPSVPKPHRVPSFDAPPPASSRAHDEKPTERASHSRPGHPLRSTTVPPVNPPPPLSRSHTVPRPGRSAAFSDNEDGPARPRLFAEMEAGLRSPVAGLRSPRMGFVFSSLASASTPSPAGNITTSAREHPGRPSRSSAVHIGPQPQPGHTSTNTNTSHTNASKHDSTATVREAAPGDKGRCSPGDTSPASAKDTPDPAPESSQETGEHAQAEPEQQPKNEDASSPKEESVPGPEQEPAGADGPKTTETEAPAGSGATSDAAADAPAPATASPSEPSPAPPAPSENAPHNPAPQAKRAEFKVAVESDSDTEREGQQPPLQTRRAPMSQPAASGSSPSHRQPHTSEPAPAQTSTSTSTSTSKGPTTSTHANAPAGASSYLPHGLRHSASRNGESPPLRHSASRSAEARDRHTSTKPSPPLSKSTTPPLSKPSPPPAMSAALRDMLTRRDKLREQMSDLALELERVQSSIHTEEERLRVEAERQRIERERQEHEQRRAAEQREKRASPPHERERPARGKTPGPDRGYASEWENWQHDPAAWERAQKKQEEERLRAEQLRQWAAQAKEKEERARREQQQQRAREEARRRADEEARRKVEEEAARRRAEDSARGQRLSKMVVHAWDEYNTFWTNLQRGGDAPLRMATIRWPVIYIDPKFAASPELVLSLLTVHQIATFLLSPFHSQEKSHKERIRDALLRWHPDRFTGRFLNRVVESDQALVVQGLNVVTSILKSLLDRL